MRLADRAFWRQLHDVRARRRVTTAAIFLGNFGTAKAAIYVAPLLIAAFATKEVYGGIEFAQSITLLLATLLAAPPLSGMTQIFLVSRRGTLADIAAAVTAGGCVLGLLATGVALMLHASPLISLAAAALAMAVVQNAVAGVYRTLNRRNLTAWTDGVPLLVAGVIIGVQLALTGHTGIVSTTAGYLLVTAATLIISLVALTRTRQAGLRARMAEAFRVGFPMMVVSLLSIWLGVGGRLLLGAFAPNALAAYGVAFRISGFALGIHQLIFTALFARLYASRTRAADRLLSFGLAAAGLLCVVLALVGPFLPDLIRLRALHGDDIGTYRRLVPVVTLQVFLWIAYAMLQQRVNRARLAGRAILPTAAVMLGGLALIAGVATFVSNDVVLLCWLIALHSGALHAVNVVLLARRGLPHARVAWVSVIGAGVLLTIAALASMLAP